MNQDTKVSLSAKDVMVDAYNEKTRTVWVLVYYPEGPVYHEPWIETIGLYAQSIGEKVSDPEAYWLSLSTIEQKEMMAKMYTAVYGMSKLEGVQTGYCSGKAPAPADMFRAFPARFIAAIAERDEEGDNPEDELSDCGRLPSISYERMNGGSNPLRPLSSPVNYR